MIEEAVVRALQHLALFDKNTGVLFSLSAASVIM
jgi:hypothetical protein